MTYTREHIENELITANQLFMSKNKAAIAARKLADEMHPAHPAPKGRFKEWRNSDEYDEYMQAVKTWEKEYDAPAKKKIIDANVYQLYMNAVAEMLEKAISAEIEQIIISDEFLDKFDHVPVRYKKLQKALFGGFDDRYHFYFTGVWNCRIGYSFRPTDEYYPNFSGDFYYIGDSNSISDTCITREEVEKRLQGRADYYEKGLGTPYTPPTFEAVLKACKKAARIAHKHDEILTAASQKAEKLVSDNACGLSTLTTAMQGTRQIDYRR